MGLEGKSLCFAGVGGMGMAPLAAYLSAAGYTVCGHDDHLQTEVRCMLESAGVDVRDFLFSEELGSFDVLVYSSALRPDHPLLEGAREAGTGGHAPRRIISASGKGAAFARGGGESWKDHNYRFDSAWSRHKKHRC
jgi:hypothetical protein